MEIVFPIISQLWLTILSVFFFCQQRGSDELSMYNSPNSGMSSISGEFVPTTPEGGAGQNLHVAIWLEVTEGIERKD